MRLASIALLGLLLCAVPSCAQQSSGASPDIANIARESMEDMSQGDFAGIVSHFDSTMQSALPESKMRETWKQVVAQTGPLQRIESTRQDKSNGYDIVFVNCQFEKARLAARFAFSSKGEIAGLLFVPPSQATAAAPATYIENESFAEMPVTIGGGEWGLPGTLTLPKGKGPFPAVVLVHGSGPSDRDETVGANKPFRDIAQGLASAGIAVLRYDKRTMVYGSKMVTPGAQFTIDDETTDDALTAVSLLRAVKDIDSKRIFVLGHSLGGMVAPRIGAGDAEIAGLIIMAGLTRPLGEVLPAQMSYLFGLDGKISAAEKKQLGLIKREAAKTADPGLSLDSQQIILGAPSAYWLDLRSYKPTEAAKAVKQPMLVLQGGRDYQVTMVDFDNWKKALSTRQDVTFKLYPDLNHLMITGQGKSAPQEYEVAGHVDELVISDIVKWIKSPSK